MRLATRLTPAAAGVEPRGRWWLPRCVTQRPGSEPCTGRIAGQIPRNEGHSGGQGGVVKSSSLPRAFVLLTGTAALAALLTAAFPAAVEQGTGPGQRGGAPAGAPDAQGGRGRGGGVFPETEPDDS